MHKHTWTTSYREKIHPLHSYFISIPDCMKPAFVYLPINSTGVVLHSPNHHNVHLLILEESRTLFLYREWSDIDLYFHNPPDFAGNMLSQWLLIKNVKVKTHNIEERQIRLFNIFLCFSLDVFVIQISFKFNNYFI